MSNRSISKQSGFALLSIAIAVLAIGLAFSQSLFSNIKTDDTTPQQEMMVMNAIKEQINDWYRRTNVTELFSAEITPDAFRDLMKTQGILIPNKYEVSIAGPLMLQDNDVTSSYTANQTSLVFYKILIKKVEPNYDVIMATDGSTTEIRNDPNSAPIYVVVDGFLIEREKYIQTSSKLERIAKAYKTYKADMMNYMDPLKSNTINYADYLTSFYSITYDANGFSAIPPALLTSMGLSNTDVKDAWNGDIVFCPQNCGGNKDATSIVFRYNLPQSGSVNLITY